MAFRDERNANRLRIDALEGELDEKDAEIARLRAKVSEREGSRKRDKKQRKKKGPVRPVPKASDLPESDIWDIETTHPPDAWKWGIGWFGLLGATVAYLAATQGLSGQLLIPVAVFGIPGLALLKRRGLTIDRKHKTITRWDKLVFPLRRTWNVDDQELEVITRHVSANENRKSWKAGVVRLGDHELFVMKKAKATGLARRIAAYLEIGLSERGETSEEITRRATQPLRFVMGFMVVAFLIAGLVTFLLR